MKCKEHTVELKLAMDRDFDFNQLWRIYYYGVPGVT